MEDGWIKIQWKLKDSLVGSSAVATGIWLHLLLRASHRRRVLRNGFVLEPGQAVISERGLASELDVSRKVMRTHLDLFEREGMIRFEGRDRNGTTLTICKWGTYQEASGGGGPKRDRNGTETGPKRDRNAPQTESPKSPESKESSEDCSEPAKPTREPPVAAEDPPVLEIATVGDGPRFFAVTQPLIDELGEAFPHLDVLAEWRRAKAWIDANASRRKTHRGMRRFLTGWLERSQNSGRSTRGNPPPQHQRSIAERMKEQGLL